MVYTLVAITAPTSAQNSSLSLSVVKPVIPRVKQAGAIISLIVVNSLTQTYIPVKVLIVSDVICKHHGQRAGSFMSGVYCWLS